MSVKRLGTGVTAAYLLVGGLAAFEVIPIWSLGVLLTVPAAWKLVMPGGGADRVGETRLLREWALAFGYQLAIGLVVGAITR